MKACLSLYWRYRKQVFLVGLVLLGYGLFRQQPPPELFGESDKVMHCVAFFMLSMAAHLAFNRPMGWLVWPGLVMLAPASEWLQGYLQATRNFSLADVQANLLGVVAAAVVVGLGRLWLRWGRPPRI